MNKIIPFIILIFSPLSFAEIDKPLPIGLTDQEKLIVNDYLEAQQLRKFNTAPTGPIYSLGEWEEADAVFTLWKNNSLLKALSENGYVKIIADSNYDKESWLSHIKSTSLNESKFSFYITPTDSIWVRDYGPWWIVDGSGQLGIVDTIYNRPRPQDDLVPDFIGRELNVPVYKPGLVHTGGNYYSDGLGRGFSSTLVFKENSKFSVEEILNRMFEFLGLVKYVTSPLGEQVTIEHLDTFGKLVTPDTWVFSEFSKTSRFYKDSEKMVSLLNTMQSPYGTPYKIFRLKMVSNGGGENYRAYINSFISNKALYFPAYGDQADEVAKGVYQAALPGYKIISVSAQGTEWGDSVHCRTRNLIKKDTIFIFPKVQIQQNKNEELKISADIIPAPNERIQRAQVVFMKNGLETERVDMNWEQANRFALEKGGFSSGEKVEFYIQAKDSAGKTKTHPINAPAMNINFIF